MAGNTLTITLTNSSTRTLTLSTNDWPDAKLFLSTLKNGIFDDAGTWYPLSAVLQIAIS